MRPNRWRSRRRRCDRSATAARSSARRRTRAERPAAPCPRRPAARFEARRAAPALCARFGPGSATGGGPARQGGRERVEAAVGAASRWLRSPPASARRPHAPPTRARHRSSPRTAPRCLATRRPTAPADRSPRVPGRARRPPPSHARRSCSRSSPLPSVSVVAEKRYALTIDGHIRSRNSRSPAAPEVVGVRDDVERSGVGARPGVRILIEPRHQRRRLRDLVRNLAVLPLIPAQEVERGPASSQSLRSRWSPASSTARRGRRTRRIPAVRCRLRCGSPRRDRCRGTGWSQGLCRSRPWPTGMPR